MTSLTVGITCFNQRGYIGQAISSAMQQGNEELEIQVIVVDDGSTDDSAYIADKHGALVIRHENSGQCVTRQKILEAAQGDYVAMLDGDDWLEPGSLVELCKHLEESQVDFAWGMRRSWLNGKPMEWKVNHLTDNELHLDHSEEALPTQHRKGAPQIGSAVFRNDSLPSWRLDKRVKGSGAPEWFFADCVATGKTGLHAPVKVLNYRITYG